jgi:hypothetical protein
MLLDAVNETIAPGPDWPTIIAALIVGLFGGVAGAWIGAASQRKLAKRTERREAAHRLWNFHRVLHDYALELENDLIHEGAAITNTTKKDIAEAREQAYPHRGYFAADKTVLLTDLLLPYWDNGMDPMTVSNGLYKRAKELEAELRRVFGKDGR